jgi:parallel beta-helix repeat protein
VVVIGQVSTPNNGGAFRIISQSYIVVDGFTVTGTEDNGINVFSSDHITLSNNHVNYSGSASNHRNGIYLSTTTDSTISGNTTDHNTLDGIKLTTGSNNNMVNNNTSFGNAEQPSGNACGINVLSNSNYNTILHNITYANQDTGLNFYTGSNHNQVIGNLTYGNGDHGIDNNEAPDQTIVGNTVQGNYTAGINLELNSNGATVVNNIVEDNGLAPTGGRKAFNIFVDASSVSGTNLDYNLSHLVSSSVNHQVNWNGVPYESLALFKVGAPGQEVHGVQAHPNFVSPAPPATNPLTLPIVTGNYHLSAGSPAIDSANSAAPSEPALDIEGHARMDDPAVANTGAGTRTYDDRGAYEYQPALNVHSISLYTGWNLVSFNLHPADTTITTVLSNISGSYDLVYAWDATGAHSGGGNWMIYDPNRVFGNTLANLDEKMGFWIHMTAPATLNEVGSLPGTTNIPLHITAGGWNLVGYPSAASLALPDCLRDHGVGIGYTLVYAYHANDGAPWKLYNRNAIFGNDLTQMTPGWGYWIFVSGDSTWSVGY